MRPETVVAVIAVLVAVGPLALGVRSLHEGLGTQAYDPRPPSPGERVADLLAQPPPVPGALRFGLDAGAVGAIEAHGVRPDYATLWVGQWNLDHGWGTVEDELERLHAANVTPAVHLYYWGDDIHADCFTLGCQGKTMQGWDEVAVGLAVRLADKLQGAPAVVILETEFNKHQVKDNEDLDGYLAEKAARVKSLYPEARVVLGLGNWYPAAWGTWDRAAAASDAIGLQAMAGSTHDPADRTVALGDRLLDGVREARARFGKPVFVHDVAVSSYPEPDHLHTQAEALARLAHALDELHAQGVEAVIYRSFLDVPSIPLGEHYGEAERHWGLAWRETGELKPGGKAWLGAMKAARGVTLDA